MTYRVLTAVLSSTIIAAACGGSKGPAATATPAGQAAPVAVARAEPADVPSVFEAGGVVRAPHTATISSRVLASITSVHVAPGDRVQRGQTLIELDARELHANRAQAVAAAAAAGNAVGAAEADIAAATAVQTQARAARDRVLTLFDKRSATAQERDDVIAAFAAADAHLAGARARLAAAASSAEAAHAGVDAAGIATSYASLTSPFNGIVAARHADPGDVAAPGVGLLVIEESGTQHLEVTIDEGRMRHLALHQDVRVRLDDADGTAAPAVTGQVVEIARVNADSHSFVAKIELPAAAGRRSGLYGRVEFNGPSHRALVVPASAVLRRGQLALVFTVDAGQARLRQISPGATTAAGIEITAGLSAGDTVILSPGDALTDGARVSVTGGRQ